LLDNRTAGSMIGYQRDNVSVCPSVRPSVRPSVSDTVRLKATPIWNVRPTCRPVFVGGVWGLTLSRVQWLTSLMKSR